MEENVEIEEIHEEKFEMLQIEENYPIQPPVQITPTSSHSPQPIYPPEVSHTKP